MVKRITTEMNGGSATMRDIAALVGVSQATVSYVLNSKPNARVSPVTRRRVLEAAARLHYRPNAIARAMASGLSRIVGVYQPHVGHSPLSGMWNIAVTRGVSEALHANHFHLLLYGYRDTDEASPSAFLDGRVDGLIVLAPHLDDSLPGQIARAGLPIAVIGGQRPEGVRAVSVDTDNVAGGRMATEHLLGLGHTRIAHLKGPANVPNALDRQSGYAMALRECGLPVRPDYLVQGSFDEGGGYRSAAVALSLTPRPTALFAANDIAALGALKACAERGLRVPEDVSIVAYDDSPVCELVRPTLTSVRQQAAEMGRIAAELLLALVMGEEPPVTHRRLAPELIARESSGKP